MRQRLVHVLVDVKAVEEDGRVLVRHQIPTETVDRHLLCARKNTQQTVIVTAVLYVGNKYIADYIKKIKIRIISVY